MLTSCHYCGRIHVKDFDCGKRPKPKQDQSGECNSFRGTYAWKKKRKQINERDLYLCRYGLYVGETIYTDLSVHHIEPLGERYDMRLDDDNLITLSDKYHEMAEDGKISRELLHRLATSPPTLNVRDGRTLSTDHGLLYKNNSQNETR